VRAFDPWPGASTAWQGQHLKLLRASALVEPGTAEPPGTVLARSGKLVVVTGDGLLRLEQVQLAGRAAMPAGDFVRGHPAFAGARLGME
jgi:methionyl-tRNA formyltransferase